MSNEWLAVGAEVVILQPWNRAALRAESTTVDRILKRDVVLANGARFRLDRLQHTVGGTWGTTVYLVPPDDPRVATTRAEIRLNRARSRARAAFDDWNRDKASARDVIAALTAYAELEEAS